jgi:hypothetical protein
MELQQMRVDTMKSLSIALIGSAIVFSVIPSIVAATDQNPPVRRALLVGCTAYPGLPNHQLEGPGNDIPDFRDLLIKEFQFPQENITSLIEGVGEQNRPTRKNIQAGFERLAQISAKGDYVVILLSGHGAQQPDQRDHPDELDGVDEIFLPADAGPWNPARLMVENAIVDDELGAWVKAIQDKGAFVWLILDSCHSGTMTRGGVGETAKEIPAGSLVPSAVLEQAHQAALNVKKEERVLEVDNNDGAIANSTGWVGLYAAQPNELTFEGRYAGDGKVRGLLIYHLCKVLPKYKGRPYRQIAQAVLDEYRIERQYGPTPMLEGDVGRILFGEGLAAPTITLTHNKNSDWSIDAGDLKGLTVGTILAVYPNEGPRDKDHRAGHVKILPRGFRLDRAAVEPCEFGEMKRNNALPDRAICEPVYFNYGDMTMKIAVDRYVGFDQPRDGEWKTIRLDEATRTRLDGILQKTLEGDRIPFRAIADPEGADWLVRAVPADREKIYLVPNTVVSTGDVPKLFGPIAADPSKLNEILGRIVRATRLVRITGKAQEQLALIGDKESLEISLYKFKDEDDRKGELIAENARGYEFRDGEIIGFLVTNKGREPLDVTLLFVDSGFGIDPFFPKNMGTDNRINHDEKLMRRGKINAKTTGIEHLVAISVSSDNVALNANFAFLAQPTLQLARGAGAARGGDLRRDVDSPFGELMQTGMFGGEQRRGIDDLEMKKMQLKVISWRTVSPENKGNGE